MSILINRYRERYLRNRNKKAMTDKLERYLFLDIDGVLNTNRYGNYLINNDMNNCDEDGDLFDPEAVANLKLILESVPDTKLIISSSWRFKGWDWMNLLWKKRKLPGTVYSMIPGLEKVMFASHVPGQSNSYSVYPYGTRGIEIYEWLRLNACQNPLSYRYAIIDDDTSDFLLMQKDHLVATNPWDGITKEVAVKAIEFLL